MVMGLVEDDAKVLAAYEAVQVPLLNGEYAGVEPREGDGERRGGAGEGAAGPVGDDLLRAGQAAVEPRLRRAEAATCEEPPQALVDADLRAARHTR